MLDHGFGVHPGMPVTIAGREVGSVSEVVLTDERNVRLTLEVEEAYAQHVHEDSAVRVLQLLSGRYVEITAGRGKPLPSGGELFYGQNFDVLLTLADLDLPETLRRLERALEQVSVATASLGLEDQDLGALLASTTRLVTGLDRGDGAVGRLLHDDDAYDEVMTLVRDADRLVARTDALLTEVRATTATIDEAGKAVVGATGSLDKAAARLDGTLQPLPQTLDRLDDALVEMTVTLEALQRLPILRKQVEAVEAATPR